MQQTKIIHITDEKNKNTPQYIHEIVCISLLGQMTRQAPNAVLQAYQKNRGKGWGVIAKEMGIKPGSREFHALKRGDFALSRNSDNKGAEKHGKGKGKGHNK